MNILVTGASGTVGSALTKRLLERHESVYCQSRSLQQSRWGEKWIRFDLTDSAAALSDLPEWDLVFHLAAQTSAPEARDDPIQALRDNVTALATLLDVLRAQENVPMVVIAGTVTQVGLPGTSLIHEGLRDEPLTFYDTTKLAAELVLKQYVREGWVRGCCLRLATVYGATSVKQASDRGVIDKVVRAAMDGHPIFVYGEGHYERDYVHIDDVVEAFLAAAEHQEQVNGKSFVIGTGRGISIKDAFTCAADIAASITGQRVNVESMEPPKGLSPIDFRSAVIDSRAFRDATGWTPKYDLRNGLAKSYGVDEDSQRR